MEAYIIAFVCSLVASFGLTPAVMAIVNKLHYGQYIRQDGPQSHQVKRGTPTLGGAAIILSILIGWGAAAGFRYAVHRTIPTPSALLALFCLVGFGLIGFIDDFLKVKKKRNLGLTIHAKLILQVLVASGYAILSLLFPRKASIRVGRTSISWIADSSVNLAFAGNVIGIILFIIWVNFLMAAWTNAINLTDGLDGLAAGSSLTAFIGFAIIAFWESYHLVGSPTPGLHYVASDPQDLVVIALSCVASLMGFLWYNVHPAEIFMGDTGSLALGGLFAAMSVSLHVEILAVIMGGLFVMETLSDVIQIGAFHMFHKRIFKMAPLHHHFELKGWPETRVVTRFWMIECGYVIISIIIFYSDWLIKSGSMH